MALKIGLVDYGAGNVMAVKRALQKLGVEPLLHHTYEQLLRCDKLILPGVGHFAQGMKKLRDLELDNILTTLVLKEHKPILGICLGMQMMAKESEETNNCMGLGWINVKVKRLPSSDNGSLPVPHIGWNNMQWSKDAILFKNLSHTAKFYFSHSYALEYAEELTRMATTQYNTEFVSALEQPPFFGIQAHPEKSYTQGLRIFQNFIDW